MKLYSCIKVNNCNGEGSKRYVYRGMARKGGEERNEREL